MPKITYSYARPKPAVPEDKLRELIERYQRERKVRSDDMAKALYLASGSVYRQKKMRGFELFSLCEFAACCRKLQIPREVIAEVLTEYMVGK